MNVVSREESLREGLLNLEPPQETEMKKNLSKNARKKRNRKIRKKKNTESEVSSQDDNTRAEMSKNEKKMLFRQKVKQRQELREIKEKISYVRQNPHVLQKMTEDISKLM